MYFKASIIWSSSSESTYIQRSSGGEISLCGGIFDKTIKQPAYIDSRMAIGKPSPFDNDIETSASSMCSIAKSLETLPLKFILILSGTCFEAFKRLCLILPSPKKIISALSFDFFNASSNAI